MKTDIWAPEKSIKDTMFEKRGTLMPMKLEYLDMANAFVNSEDGFYLIRALEKTSNIELFALKSVQILIDYQWMYWRKAKNLTYGLPILINFLFFWYWSNIVLHHLGESGFDQQNTICIAVLNILSVYMIVNELIIVYRNVWRIFNQERLITLIGAGLNMWNSLYTEESQNERSFWVMQTWVALLIYSRALLYLRTFDTFSWLIRMIIACMQDMVVFLIIFSIGVIAFADAFSSIARGL